MCLPNNLARPQAEKKQKISTHIRSSFVEELVSRTSKIWSWYLAKHSRPWPKNNKTYVLT